MSQKSTIILDYDNLQHFYDGAALVAEAADKKESFILGSLPFLLLSFFSFFIGFHHTALLPACDGGGNNNNNDTINGKVNCILHGKIHNELLLLSQLLVPLSSLLNMVKLAKQVFWVVM